MFNAITDSLISARDRVTDFDTTADTFQLDVAVTGVDAGVTGAASTTVDLQGLVSGKLLANHAILVAVSSGALNGHSYVIIDHNAAANYQPGADYIIDVTGITGTLTAADFIV